MPKITKRLVDAAEARPAEYFVWDSEIPGFGLRVLPSGRKGYVVPVSRAGRRSPADQPLGPSTVLTCEHRARTRAISHWSAAAAMARTTPPPHGTRGRARRSR